MDQIYVFIIHNDVWIYIVCGLGLFGYASEYIRARSILRRAVFGLERERGTLKRNNALLLIATFSLIGGMVFFVNTRIAPQLPEELLFPPTPTPDIFRTPLATLAPIQSPVPSPTPPLVPTITLPGQQAPAEDGSSDQVPADEQATPTVSPTLGPTVTPAIGCNLDLNFTEPREGSVASGTITFSGTAVSDSFGGYRLEANGPQTDGEWASLLGRTIDQPVVGSILGNANLSQWAAGPYLIRLVLVDVNQVDVGICVTQITLNN